MAVYALRLTDEALDNIDAIVGYIAHESGFAPAEAVLERIYKGLETLDRMPHRCPTSKKLWVAAQNGRDYIFLGLPYVAPFLIDEVAKTVTVFAVYHTSMDWQT